MRLDAGKSRSPVQRARGVAQQHAAQAEGPGVLLARGAQAQAGTLGRVQAPADARPFNPLHERGQVVGAQLMTARHAGHVQQVAQLAGAEALLRRQQQPVQRHQDGLVAALALVGNAPGDVPRTAPCVLAEDSADGGREAVHVRHHHHHVARVQRLAGRGLCEKSQQLVVQDLHLAVRAVGPVEDDGAVCVFDGCARVLGQGQQVADGGLRLLQQRLASAFVEQVHARWLEAFLCGLHVVKSVQLAHEVPALAAPSGQQRVTVGVQVLHRQLGRVGAGSQRMAAARGTQQFAAVDDVGPVEAAGVGHGHQHLAVRRQGGNGLQRLVRDVGGAEQHHAARQAGETLRGSRLRQGLEKTLLQHGARTALLVGLQGAQHGAPERGLPLLVGRHGAGGARAAVLGAAQTVVALGPVLQPVAPVDLVLVQQVGQALGQLQAPRRITCAQERGHRLEAGLRGQVRQQVHQAPGERQLVQWRHARHGLPAQHGAVGAPDESRWQLHTRGRAHTEGTSHFHLQPLGHAVALDEEDLFLQWAQRVARQPGEHSLGQQFQAVAVEDEQACGGWRVGCGGHGPALFQQAAKGLLQLGHER